MSIELQHLNHNQLNELIVRAQQQQKNLRKQKVTEVRKQVHAIIKAEGYQFEDIFGQPSGKRPTNPVQPKYRNPHDPSQTWTGRGKRPRWFNDALQNGTSKQSMAV